MLSDDNFYEIESALMDEELPKLNEYVEIGEPVRCKDILPLEKYKENNIYNSQVIEMNTDLKPYGWQENTTTI